MKTRRGTGARRLSAMLLVAVMWAGSGGPVQAQERQERPMRDRLEAQVRARFEAIVKRELGLDDETMVRLDAELEALQQERRALGMRQRDLRRELASTGTLLSEAQARDVLDELVRVQEEEVSLLRREQERLLQVLTPPQLVRFYTLRERFAERVRELRQRRSGGPGGSGGGPGMPLRSPLR